MKTHTFRRLIVSCLVSAALVGAAVSSPIAQGAVHTLMVWGNNNPQYEIGAFAMASTNADASYTKVRLLGVGDGVIVCQEGTRDGTWCVDSADFWGKSTAKMRANIVPYGWITGESVHFSGGQTIATKQQSVYVAEPSPDPYEEQNCWANGGYWNGYTCENANSPIIIDTANHPSDRYRLTSVRNGVLFDLDANGVLERVAWVANGNRVAFLALDRNGNGTIDDGSELFGNHTLPGVNNGFAALAAIESHNGDALLDAADPLFARLLLWHDRNRDGVSQAGELQPATNELDAIGLTYWANDRADRYGNLYKFEGFARKAAQDRRRNAPTAAEREFTIYDVFLQTR